MKYTQQQLKIVNSEGKRILVNSVAGSGKTTTIKGVIKRALSSGIKADEIMVCTFTRKMASELRENNKKISWCDTIHGIAFRILDEHKDMVGYKRMILIDDIEDKDLIKSIISRNYLKITQKRAQDIIQGYCHMGNLKSPIKHEEIFLKTYLRELRERDFVTYGLLEYYAEKVLERCPEIGFKLIVVDEYQDTSVIESRIVNLLAKDRLIMAGDVMQSIYGFRGADISNMVKAQVDTKHEMSLSFRIPEEISGLANHLISLNDFGYGLNIVSEKRGGTLNIVEDIRHEALCDELDCILGKFSPEQVYILTRTNRQIEYLVKALEYYPIDKELSAVKNMQYLSYLNIACTAYYNGYYNYALTRLLRLFDYRDSDLIKWENEGGSIYEKVRGHVAIMEFDSAMRREMPFHDKAQVLLPMFEKRRMEYDTVMTKVLPYLEDIDTAIDYMEWYESMSIADFMPKDKIAIMTVHMAKGMENEAVVLPFVEDGTFPNSRSTFQEELRLFYVAVTRAKQHLSIMHNKSVFLGGYSGS